MVFRTAGLWPASWPWAGQRPPVRKRMSLNMTRHWSGALPVMNGP